MNTAPEKNLKTEREDCKCDLKHTTKAHLKLSSAVQTLFYLPTVAIEDFQWAKRNGMGTVF